VVDLAENSSGTWQARLERVLTSYTAVLFDHPGLAQSALVSRPSGVHYVRLLERLLALLDEGEVPPGQAAWGVDLLLQYATSTAAEHSAPNNSADADARWSALTDAIQNANPQTHPLVARHATALLAGEPSARLSWGFRTLITGIENTPLTS
jgi:hypothetical protein